MTESGARTALQSHVKHHCCWGPGPARQMTVSSINQIFSYHVSSITSRSIYIYTLTHCSEVGFSWLQYILQTFTERREAFWTWAPHVGGDIDGPEEGVAPSPWEIHVNPPKLFHNEVTSCEVFELPTPKCVDVYSAYFSLTLGTTYSIGKAMPSMSRHRDFVLCPLPWKRMGNSSKRPYWYTA